MEKEKLYQLLISQSDHRLGVEVLINMDMAYIHDFFNAHTHPTSYKNSIPMFLDGLEYPEFHKTYITINEMAITFYYDGGCTMRLMPKIQINDFITEFDWGTISLIYEKTI